MSYPSLRLHIAGQWLSHASGGERAVINPADEKTLAVLPLAGASEIDASAESAAEGFKVWSRNSAYERYAVVRRAAQLLRDRSKEIARVLTLEQGKLLTESLREVVLAADILDFQAEEARRLYGRTVPPRVPGILTQTVQRFPIGPVAAFTPWNFPANLPARKLGSALAAGCSVVIKPAEETPATCMLMVQCFLDAGVPPHALNFLCGEPAEVSTRLIAHPAIRKISFTGSVAVGKHLGVLAARGVKRYTAELGGHAPVIVCEDADLSFALRSSIAAKFRNAGQVCASPIRFYVHESHMARWTAEFTSAARGLKIGSGLEADTQMGPLAHARRLEDMQRFVEDASSTGARLLCGGARLSRDGYFFAPTVFADAAPTSRLMTVEPFGPIAVIQPFQKLDEAIAAANALPYGLSAYAFTHDVATTHRLGEEIEAGMVGINHFGISQPEAPFGGLKESGLGQEMGAEGLLHYTDVKLIVVGAPS